MLDRSLRTGYGTGRVGAARGEPGSIGVVVLTLIRSVVMFLLG
jgi:hypothetical protein